MQNQIYEYKTFWSKEDKMYVGLCTEFPSLSCLHKRQDTARNEIKSLVEDIVLEMIKNDCGR